MAANQEIFDAFLRHQVQLQRLTNGQAARLITSLNGTNEEVAAAIFLALGKIKATKTLSRARSREYSALMKKISVVRKAGFDSIRIDYSIELEKLIAHELTFTENVIDRNMPVAIKYKAPNLAVLSSAVLSNGQYNGYSVMEWFQGIEEADAKRIYKTVKDGITQGLSNDAIIRSVLGTKNMGYRNGIQHRTHNALRNMVRTVTAGVTADSRNAWIMQNSDIIAYENYMATLDGRTTMMCADLDGKQFAVGTGPIPPLHMNCRSVRIPVIDLLSKKGLIGDRPYVRDTRTTRQMKKDFRAIAKNRIGKNEWSARTLSERRSLINKEKAIWQKDAVGLVDANVTYKDWFARQPSSFQRSYLGKKRYQAYVDGASFSSFVSPTGSRFSLADLEKMEIIK